MYPILLDWGPVVLPAWHTFYVLGAMAAFWLLLYLAIRYAPQIERSDLSRLYIVGYVSGYLGARLLSILVEEPDVKGLSETLLAVGRFGAMTFYGGAIGCFVGGATYAWWRKLPLTTLIDLSIPAGLLGMAIGRVGCFLNGDDYGIPAHLGGDGQPPFWAVTFPVLKDGVARVPVQLLEAGLVAALVLVLCLNFRRLRSNFRPGVIGYLGIVGYANLRFGLEFWRDDFRGFAFGTWLSTSQFISILVLAACGLTLPFWLRQAKD